MKWKQQFLVITGVSHWQLIFNLFIIGIVIVSWISKKMISIGFSLCAIYIGIIFLMMFLEHKRTLRSRKICDLLEEVTTTWYFGINIIILWLLSHIIHNNLLLVFLEILILVGPTFFLIFIKHYKNK